MHSKYVGNNPRYQGRTALTTYADRLPGTVLVQFDEPTYAESGLPLHLGWHAFPAADWERAEEIVR